MPLSPRQKRRVILLVGFLVVGGITIQHLFASTTLRHEKYDDVLSHSQQQPTTTTTATTTTQSTPQSTQSPQAIPHEPPHETPHEVPHEPPHEAPHEVPHEAPHAAPHEVPRSSTTQQNVGGSGAGADTTRQSAVRDAILHSWNAYKKYAWGHDELKPVSKQPEDWACDGCSHTGIGLTMIDAMDTLYLAGLTNEFEDAAAWLEKNLSFNKAMKVSMFETTIRVLGGLLSAYDLSGKEFLLDQAKDLANRLLPTFDTPTGLPNALVHLTSGEHHNWGWNGGRFILAEVGTLQLEFRTLSLLTGNPVYDQKATVAMRHLVKEAAGKNGAFPVELDSGGGYATQRTSLGAFGDSFYEYILKQWILTENEGMHKIFTKTAKFIQDEMIVNDGGLTYVGEWNHGASSVMDHLACFSGGMFALAWMNEKGPEREKYLKSGAGITETCWKMYSSTETGLAADQVNFMSGQIHTSTPDFKLRPETVESLFYMWRMTHEQKYRDWGWAIFQAINKHCKLAEGYADITDVNNPDGYHQDKMESFWLAETLKYLYLLFSDDDLVPLDKWVFNTEAHPVKIRPQKQPGLDLSTYLQ